MVTDPAGPSRNIIFPISMAAASSGLRQPTHSPLALYWSTTGPLRLPGRTPRGPCSELQSKTYVPAAQGLKLVCGQHEMSWCHFTSSPPLDHLKLSFEWWNFTSGPTRFGD